MQCLVIVNGYWSRRRIGDINFCDNLLYWRTVEGNITMSARAKQQRDEWEVKLVAANQSFLQMCSTIPVQKRAVTRMVTELQAVWDKFIIKPQFVL